MGTFSSELEAARAYDRAAIRYRGARCVARACSCRRVATSLTLLCSAVTNFNISEYDGDDLGDMPAESAMDGVADGLSDALLLGADGAMGGAASEAMFQDFFLHPMGGPPMPMEAHMAAAGAAAHILPQHGRMLHEDMVMMPGAMATHDFASFANEGGWGFNM